MGTAEAIFRAAKRFGLSGKLRRWALLFRNQKTENVYINPARDEHLLANQEILGRFFPDLLQKQLSRAQEAELGQSAYAAVAR